MCIIIIDYDCHHRGEENFPCRSYMQKLERSIQHRPSFRQRFFRISRSSCTVVCTQKPGRRRVFSKCPRCVDRDRRERARKERETEMHVMLAREEHDKREKQKLQERRRSQRKSAFRCSKCTAEKRRPDQLSRAANEGLCCARGIEEFEEFEKASRYYPQPSARGTFANQPRPASIPTREQRFPEIRYMTSTEKARENAKVAANTYGWDRTRTGSVELDPSLVAGYLNSSGDLPNIMETASLPPEPKYEELGIDYTLWHQMQDVKLGAHGRIPPPPEKPLPVRPLATKQKNMIPRKPVAQSTLGRSLTGSIEISPPSSRNSPPSDFSVSPLSSPRLSTLVRSSASFINDELHDLLDDSMTEWKPTPAPKYRY